MIKRFHVEPTNICTLKCAACARTKFINQWPQHWRNHSLDVEHLLKFLDINLDDKAMLLCGNYGDPIYHPDFINFVKRLKENNVTLSIVTNGSYKTQTWWEELTKILTKKDEITFSIDGIPDNFKQYRQNANWESIETALTVVGKSDVASEWKYIPFKFNENNIDQAKELSLKFGIDTFVVDPSDRYDDSTIDLMPTKIAFIGSRYASSQSRKKDNNVTEISPKCHDNQQYFISAEGFYAPCPFLADHRFYYKNQFGKNKNEYNIRNTTISEILSRPAVVEFSNTLASHSGCRHNCSKIN